MLRFSREGVELDARSKEIIEHETTLLEEMRELKLKQFNQGALKNLSNA